MYKYVYITVYTHTCYISLYICNVFFPCKGESLYLSSSYEFLLPVFVWRLDGGSKLCRNM